MNTTRKIVVSILATSFLGATALPTLAQQSATGESQKMEKRMAHKGASKRGGGKRQGMKMAFERYDSNEDGVITQEEVDAVVVERFNDLAGDDNTITLEQYRDAWMERSADHQVRGFQRLDRDGDGAVTKAEYDSASERMFSRLDRDGNGELTRATRNADKSAKRSGQRDGNKSAKRSGGHGKKGMRGGSHRGGGNVAALMERFDVDKDGKITRAEFDEVRAAVFGGADGDSNGSISLSEFATIWQDLNNDRIVRGFQRLDSDGDLKITQEEYAARSNDFVKKHDRNGDGVVTKADRGGGKHKGKKGHRSMNKSSDKAPQKAKSGSTESATQTKAQDT
ncbi:MAG: calcium-binding protein [Alphaproteobacteria bacterium]|nr:calcium-binding protein [Alphaproteobacteria bacterium]